MTQILAFGDSITDGAYDEQGGWATRLQVHFMSENLKQDVLENETNWVYNLGISADTTIELLNRVESEAKARKVARTDKKSLFIFAIGINDSKSEGTAEDFFLNEEKFRQNLLQLINIAKKYTDKIILVGITPVIERLTTPIYDNVWYTNEWIQEFDSIVKQLALEQATTYIEFFETMSVLSDIDKYFIDGLHPNTQGHELMFKKIKQVVLEYLNS